MEKNADDIIVKKYAVKSHSFSEGPGEVWLKNIDELKDVPIEQLKWFFDESSCLSLNEGDRLFTQGEAIKGTYVIVEGKIRLCMQQNNELREITVFEAKAITGYLPFSRAKLSTGFGDAISPVKLIFLPVQKTREMIRTHFELTQALVHIMTTRVRNFTTIQQQNEKMMALGKLSAGLAHELNNPAAAVVRGSVSLKKHLQMTPETFKKVMEIRMSTEEVDMVNNKMFAILNRDEKPQLTLMKRSAQEDDLTDWLDDAEVGNSTELAENFVDFGFTVDDLDDFARHVPKTNLSAVFNWINSNLVTEKMVGDIEEASKRIADLVGSVKNFTHMDQGHDKQYADIHNGIRNTLTMLQYKIRKGNVEVVQNFDLNLPPVKAMIGELNQVWTNLIDNALDAMESNGKGVLEIKTIQDKEFVQVTIIDNGPGIPEEIKSRIFDPFFTTKEVGKGTGLGLDVVTNIVRQHRGSIKVNSVTGRTEFLICFPIDG